MKLPFRNSFISLIIKSDKRELHEIRICVIKIFTSNNIFTSIYQCHFSLNCYYEIIIKITTTAKNNMTFTEC